MPGKEFGLDRTWDLPNGNRVVSVRVGSKLPVTLQAFRSQAPAHVPELSQVEVPQMVPPRCNGTVTYTWVGPWQALRTGLAMLTWEAETGAAPPATKLAGFMGPLAIGSRVPCVPIPFRKCRPTLQPR